MSIISIIGTGDMAAAIAGRTAKAGHTVEVTNRDPAKARALADQLAAGAITGTWGAAPARPMVPPPALPPAPRQQRDAAVTRPRVEIIDGDRVAAGGMAAR